MTSYEVEHNLPSQPAQPTRPPRRPDLSTFFSTLELVDTSSTSNQHALPLPVNISAAFRILAHAFERMRQDSGDEGNGGGLLDGMIGELLAEAEMPPREVKGVDDEFFDELERVPKKMLKKTDACPICNNPFLDDEYPLVVRLPCHQNHIFDLECIQPWLKLHTTCPLDRKDLVKKKEPPPKPSKEAGKEEEEDYDDMYA